MASLSVQYPTPLFTFSLCFPQSRLPLLIIFLEIWITAAYLTNFTDFPNFVEMFVEIWITLGHFANLVEIWITQSIYKPLSPGLASPYLSFLESGGDYVS